MSGLVGYGSSSEDENEISSRPDTLSTASTSKVKDEAVSKEADSIKTIVGPQPDPADAATLTPTNEPQEAPSFETERETIQRLTAPNVPVNAIPPSPPGSPDSTANVRFSRFLELKSKGIHFNEDLAQKSSYLNPNLFSTMLHRAGLEDKAQYQSSLPTSTWNVVDFPDDVYYEHLGKKQRSIRENKEEAKKAQSVAGKRVLEFVPPRSSDKSSSKTNSQKDGIGPGIAKSTQDIVKKRKL